MGRLPVIVPEWYRPIWDPLAYWSNALIWPAWSAIFSALALAATIYLATSSDRQRRKSDAAFLEAVAYLGDLALMAPRVALANVANGRPWADEQQAKIAVFFHNNKVLDQLNDIDLTKVPTTAALEAILGLRVYLQTILAVAENRNVDSSPENARVWTERTEAELRGLYKEARRVGGRRSGKQRFDHLSGPHAKPLDQWWDPSGYVPRTNEEAANSEAAVTDDQPAP